MLQPFEHNYKTNARCSTAMPYPYITTTSRDVVDQRVFAPDMTREGPEVQSQIQAAVPYN